MPVFLKWNANIVISIKICYKIPEKDKRALSAHTATYAQYLSCNVGGQVGTKKQCGIGDILSLSHACLLYTSDAADE